MPPQRRRRHERATLTVQPGENSITSDSDNGQQPRPPLLRSTAKASPCSCSKSKPQQGRASSSSPHVSSAPLKCCFPPHVDPTLPPHTLILGTCPSDTSLRLHQYFGHGSNCFWDIVGSVLGFERQRTPYVDQVAALTSAGYALWDVLASRRGKGSLDSNTVRGSDVPNDVRTLVEQTLPSVRRICINSKSSAKFFLRHNADWLHSDHVEWHLTNDSAVSVFGKAVRAHNNRGQDCAGREGSTRTDNSSTSRRVLHLAVMESTSPANAPSRQARLEAGVTIDPLNKGTSVMEFKRSKWIKDCFFQEKPTKRTTKTSYCIEGYQQKTVPAVKQEVAATEDINGAGNSSKRTSATIVRSRFWSSSHAVSAGTVKDEQWV